MRDALPEVAVAAGKITQFRELRARQEQRDTQLETHQHRLREEVDDGSGPLGVGEECHRRDEQRGSRGKRRVASGVAFRNLAEGGADDERSPR